MEKELEEIMTGRGAGQGVGKGGISDTPIYAKDDTTKFFDGSED